MSQQEQPTESGTEPTRLPPEERRSLLDELQRLYHQIWSAIWARRFDQSDRDYGVARDPGILGTLNRQIDEAVKEKGMQPGVELADDDPDDDDQDDDETVSTEGKSAVGTLSSSNRPGVLADYLQSRDRLTAVQPNLGEQMRASTWKHMVAAMRLAHKGDEKGAKVHAELANNAMKEASVYMTEEEYKAFAIEVEERLASMQTRE